MHYHAEVVIPDEGDVEELVRAALAPHKQGDEGGLWDWWQIGGRYTGSHDAYDPETDPENIVVCNLCAGSGKRDDELGRRARLSDPRYTCNGCQGQGKHTAWPTQWVSHAGDTINVADATAELQAYALFLPDGTVLVREEWTGGAWEKTDFDGKVRAALEARGITTGRLVTVDYHS